MTEVDISDSQDQRRGIWVKQRLAMYGQTCNARRAAACGLSAAHTQRKVVKTPHTHSAKCENIILIDEIRGGDAVGNYFIVYVQSVV